MRNPTIILGQLARKPHDYRFKRLYRLLYNPLWYEIAWRRLIPSQHPLPSLPPTDGAPIPHQPDPILLGQLIEQLRKKKYRPHNMVWETPSPPPRRGKNRRQRRPTPRPSYRLRQEDLIVQEVLRIILEACYEPHFLSVSHAFRGRRGCHTALTQVQRSFTDVVWILKPTQSILPVLDKKTMIRILQQKIDDTACLQLIQHMLKARYLHAWNYNTMGYHNTPRGSIIGPLLSNIYLHELDLWMLRFQTHFARQENKRLTYTRHGDEWLIGLSGSKNDALYLQEKLEKFFKKNLEIPQNLIEVSLQHSKRKIRFLGYDVSAPPHPHKKHNPCRLSLPQSVWTKKLFDLGAIRIHPTTHIWKALHRPYLVPLDDYAILHAYNREIEKIYHYYRLAHNVSQLQRFGYLMRLSFYKTMASKYKSTVRKIAQKYCFEGKPGVIRPTPTGSEVILFYHSGFQQQRIPDTTLSIPNDSKGQGK
ncbi:reverse transcriptase/maturase family protein [Pasteuria penetrans]|uniref:reverse transcriptase/maturase family protein n=1 Tax=Pasteuria penetrans TaxID=86005 RepID=UPI000FC1985A|nr:reverse transcriptase/maturase family protein [Pasteuria penetrans]